MSLKLNNKKVINAKVEGIRMYDYPDCVDAYFDDAVFADTLMPLEPAQLGDLKEQNLDTFYEMLHDEVMSNY